MKLLLSLLITCLCLGCDAEIEAEAESVAERYIKITNNCSEDLWTHQLNLPGHDADTSIPKGTSVEFKVGDGSFPSISIWPKVGCDKTGQNCTWGQAWNPCSNPISPGCQPNSMPEFELTFDARDTGRVWVDLSLVNGYSEPQFKIIPLATDVGQGNCKIADCTGLTEKTCPQAEDLSMGGKYPDYKSVDLRYSMPREFLGSSALCLRHDPHTSGAAYPFP